jgi:phosphoenolpyruvate carboxykinase (GTP)
MLRTLTAGKLFPTIFTNTALNQETNEPWWEGLDGPVPKNLADWEGNPWDSAQGKKAAHPNSRFTTSLHNCPTLSRDFDNPKGVPISAIILGGRRTDLIPLVTEAFNWPNGVFLGARGGSETTAAAAHQVGVLRRDPMAMLPFCGYNMGDYFKHWLNIGKKLTHPPKIFSVNWFRTNEKDEFIWPGFSENIRVLKWIIERVNNRIEAKETPIGFVPYLKDLNLEGLNIPENELKKLTSINMEDWCGEVKEIKDFLEQFGKHIPEEIWRQYQALAKHI